MMGEFKFLKTQGEKTEWDQNFHLQAGGTNPSRHYGKKKKRYNSTSYPCNKSIFTAYIFTWFVTSSVDGLYVVIALLPTENTRLYLKRWENKEYSWIKTVKFKYLLFHCGENILNPIPLGLFLEPVIPGSVYLTPLLISKLEKLLT